MLDIQGLRDTPLKREPFDHVIVPGFITRDALAQVGATFPEISDAGSYPLAALRFGDAFGDLVAMLEGPAMTDAVAEKFGISLDGHPTMLTVRGRCRPSDGQIHTDSKSKLITALIYLNDGWDADGGRLRLLRSGEDIDAFDVEVPPDAGTLLVFRCSENAWHGHAPFEGVRRSIQLNWVRDPWYLRKEQFRHRLSSFFKAGRPA